MPKAFVTGATGYTGQAVVKELLHHGLPVVAHIRPDSSKLDTWREMFLGLGAQVDTSAWTVDALGEALSRHQPKLIFSLIGTTRHRAAEEGMGASEAYERVDYGLSRCLLDATQQSGVMATFVYLSAMGARAGASNPYMAVRGRFEAELRDTGLPYLIARPAFITGDDRAESRPMERVGASLIDVALKPLTWMGLGQTRDQYASMDSSTLARGLVRGALDADSIGKTVGPAEIRALAKR